jgi:hypothetical protein
MSTRMVQRKGTYQQWFDTNPKLLSGEIGYETDTNKFKVGDGTTNWNNLAYFINQDEVTTMTQDFATEEYVDTAITNSEVDLASAAGDNLIWNAATQQFDVSISTSDVSEGTNLYFTDERAQDAVGNVVGAGFSYNDTNGAITVNPGAMLNQIVGGLSGNSYGLVGTSAYLDVKDTNGYNKEIELDIDALESKLTLDGYSKQSDIATAKSEAISDATSQVSALIAGAPGALNTLDELAAALNDDASFATTVTNSIALKAPIDSPTFTGTVVLPSTTSIGNISATELGYVDGVTSAIQTQIDTKSNIILAVNTTAKTSAYTLVLGDANTILQMNGAFAFTVPLNSSVPYPIGTQIHLLALTDGASVAFTSGITSYATPGNKLRVSGSMATLIKLNTDTWVLAGDLTA